MKYVSFFKQSVAVLLDVIVCFSQAIASIAVLGSVEAILPSSPKIITENIRLDPAEYFIFHGSKILATW